MRSYTQRRRINRNLKVKKTFLVSPETDAGIVELTAKYHNEAEVMRVALDNLFLLEGVSISNTIGEQDEHSAELQAA